MDAKSRLILALLMSSVMVCMVTLLVTLLDLGLRSDLPAGLRRVFVLCFSHLRSSRRCARHRVPGDHHGRDLTPWSIICYSTRAADAVRSRQPELGCHPSEHLCRPK
jgi:hypothetical protein